MIATSLKREEMSSPSPEVLVMSLEELSKKNYYPTKMELKTILATNQFLTERIIRIKNVIAGVKDQITLIENRNRKLRSECDDMISNLNNI